MEFRLVEHKGGVTDLLFRIEIENFFSIRDRQVIDLRARKSVEDILGRLTPIYPGSEDRAPNVVAIFGPNAAGKSNVLRALAFAAWFIKDSFSVDPGERLPYQKFGNEKKIGEPTRLAFSFAGPKNVLDIAGGGPLCPYTYELELGPRIGGEDDQVTLERLSFQPSGHGRPSRIFERNSDGRVKAYNGFLSSQLEKTLEQILKPSSSVVSTLAKLNHQIAKAYVGSLHRFNTNIFLDKIDHDEREVAGWYIQNPSALEKLQQVARKIDLGIEEIGINTEAREPTILLRHSGLDQIMVLSQESHGTRQFLKIFPLIFLVLQQGGVAAIDEIDTLIHPILLPEMLGWFNDPEKNPHGAQLWTTCHAATLLSDLTKEEVFFCEKQEDGASELYGLAEIDKVRRQDNFLGKYLGGEYGAIPMVG